MGNVSNFTAFILFVLSTLLLVRRSIDFYTLGEKIKQFSNTINKYMEATKTNNNITEKKKDPSTDSIRLRMRILSKIEKNQNTIGMVLIIFILCMVGYGTIIQQKFSNEDLYSVAITSSVIVGLAGMIISIPYSLACYILENMKNKVIK